MNGTRWHRRRRIRCAVACIGMQPSRAWRREWWRRRRHGRAGAIGGVHPSPRAPAQARGRGAWLTDRRESPALPPAAPALPALLAAARTSRWATPRRCILTGRALHTGASTTGVGPPADCSAPLASSHSPRPLALRFPASRVPPRSCLPPAALCMSVCACSTSPTKRTLSPTEWSETKCLRTEPVASWKRGRAAQAETGHVWRGVVREFCELCCEQRRVAGQRLWRGGAEV